MRLASRHVVSGLFGLILLGTLGVEARAQSPHPDHPYAGCFQLRSVPADGPLAEEAARIDTVVEFIFEPGHSDDATKQRWSLNGKAHAPSVAFWWLEEDELVALWNYEDVLRTLRFRASEDRMEGEAIRTLPPRDSLGRLEAIPTDCPGTGRSG